MKLENQLPTLAQCKRLKELGVSQGTHFSWFGDETIRLLDNGWSEAATVGAWLFIGQTEPANNQERDWREDVNIEKPLAAAFTVAELGVMLPHCIPTYSAETVSHRNALSSGSNDAWCAAVPKSFTPRGEEQENWYEALATTEAQARAALLIHLLESGKITAADASARLADA